MIKKKKLKWINKPAQVRTPPVPTPNALSVTDLVLNLALFFIRNWNSCQNSIELTIIGNDHGNFQFSG